MGGRGYLGDEMMDVRRWSTLVDAAASSDVKRGWVHGRTREVLHRVRAFACTDERERDVESYLFDHKTETLSTLYLSHHTLYKSRSSPAASVSSLRPNSLNMTSTIRIVAVRFGESLEAVTAKASSTSGTHKPRVPPGAP